MNVEDILRIAQWAAGQTRRAVPYSANVSDRNSQVPINRKIQLQLVRKRTRDPKQKKFMEEIFRWNLDLASEKKSDLYKLSQNEFFVETYQQYLSLSDIFWELEKLSDSSRKNRDELRILEAFAVKALKYGIGNCGELSAYAFLLLLEYPQEGLKDQGLAKLDKQIPIERVQLTGVYDHVFIVMNRNVNDPENVISDPLSWWTCPC